GQMVAGLSNAGAVLVEPDRAAAIGTAVERAQTADVVLIAGKGHEDYQDIKGVKTPFSDLVHARQALAARAAQGAHA
ncbi:MAG: UDP-N-acetylmuramoyl-L-alanyl-D-glutamate--2,6-diaminopimelate ligase, partial [Hydrogenophaga sp.]|nr:UDP-N-acetylmuramoyl-L-alanyl-D-glutamate--2,6-diaminopimelate ligase [Hydrogenophaga sp.]